MVLFPSNENRNIHIIIAPSPWNEDPLKYRRHRLAVFLRKQHNTEKVIWLAQDFQNSWTELLKEPTLELVEDDIFQLRIPECKSLVKHISFLHRNIFKKVSTFPVKERNYYLWYTYPAYASLANLDLWKSIVYDCSDMWQEGEKSGSRTFDKVKKKLIARTEKTIITKANKNFTSSSQLLEHVKSYGVKNSTLVENGVDFEHFQNQQTSPIIKSEKPVLGFVGGLKPWKIDFSLLLQVAKLRKDWDFILIGSYYGNETKDFRELQKLSNVMIYPVVKPSVIGNYIHQFDVGLLPYSRNDYNEGVFPLKFYEYLACGIPIVGCGLPSTVEHVQESVYELTENNVQAFLKACERAISKKGQQREVRLNIAREADWDAKLKLIWKKVNESE